MFSPFYPSPAFSSQGSCPTRRFPGDAPCGMLPGRGIPPVQGSVWNRRRVQKNSVRFHPRSGAKRQVIIIVLKGLIFFTKLISPPIFHRVSRDFGECLERFIQLLGSIVFFWKISKLICFRLGFIYITYFIFTFKKKHCSNAHLFRFLQFNDWPLFDENVLLNYVPTEINGQIWFRQVHTSPLRIEDFKPEFMVVGICFRRHISSCFFVPTKRYPRRNYAPAFIQECHVPCVQRGPPEIFYRCALSPLAKDRRRFWNTQPWWRRAGGRTPLQRSQKIRSQQICRLPKAVTRF